jgi:hypothetical protein
VLAVDMAKAFDTLLHPFIHQVYKFFGFGENMIKWLTLLGNNREACIILDKEKNSRYFKLDTGRPQGDNISPFTFNFCEQILIFKLELDPGIVRIDRPAPLINNVAPHFLNKSNRETATNESLADDCTVLTIINKVSFSAIKKILDDFAKISGLECNYDKTALMPINQLTEEEERIVTESGFKIVNSFKLLGVNVSAVAADLISNYDSVIKKIDSLIAFWSRFRLSLPGRITIAKTFLISQINYLGSILMPSEEQLHQMQSSINNFIRRNIKISDERIYLPVDKGGLGFFNIKNFLQAQMSTWILRAKKFPIDNWRYDLHLLAPNNNPLLIRCTDVSSEEYPVLHGIITAYESFYTKFCRTGKNYIQAQIFNNELFADPETGHLITKRFFGDNFYDANTNAIRRLTFQDFFDGNNFKDIAIFRNEGINFQPATWMRLRNIMLRVKNTAVPTTSKPQSIEGFVMSWKKGSKKLRNFFTYDVNPLQSRSFLKFKELVGADPGNFSSDTWFSSWNIHSFPNDFRNFVFNCRYNYLPTNNRLNAYLDEVDPRCTYCVILDPGTQQRDSFAHCFFECNYVKNLINSIISRTRFNVDLNGITGDNCIKKLYWYGIHDNDNVTASTNYCYLFFFDSFRYILFRNRVKKRLLSLVDFVAEFVYFLQCIFCSNKKLEKLFFRTYELANFLQASG